MKVNGSNGLAATSSSRGAKAGAAQGGFSLPGMSGAASAGGLARAAAATGVASLDALLALQDVGGPLERRRRAVGRAGRILDVLDELKLDLLDGAMSPDSLQRLMRAVREERAATDDARLEGLLDEIETRASVEIAKLEIAPRAA